MDSNDLKKTYNRIAEDWNRDHQSDSWWVEGTDKFISLLKTEATVLDVGCGGGFKSKYLADKGLRVTGIDFSENMIRIAQREVPEAIFKVLDMHKVNELENAYDGIFVQAALLHIPKKEAPEVLQKIATKLKTGGYLYLAVKGKREGGVDEEVVTESDYGYKYERFFSYFSAEELTSWLQEFKMQMIFSDVKTEGSNWVQIIAKK